MSDRQKLLDDLRVAEASAQELDGRRSGTWPRLPNRELSLQVALSAVEARISDLRSRLSVINSTPVE